MTRVPPIRLLDDPESSAEERALLHAGASPVDYDVGAGLARFRAATLALTATTAVHGSSTTASAGTSGVRATTSLVGKASLKLLASLVGAGVAVGSVVALRTNAPGTTGSATTTPAVARDMRAARPDEPVAEPQAFAEERVESPIVESPRAARPAPAARRAARNPGAKAVRSAVEPTPVYLAAEEERAPEPEPVPAQAPAPVAAEAPATPVRREPISPAPAERPAQLTLPSPESASPAPSAAVAEMQGIARARALLASDPSAALDTLEKLRREHPNGIFVEERRALTVLALARTGNRAAAREQGAAFLRRYPNGPFTDRVGAAIR